MVRFARLLLSLALCALCLGIVAPASSVSAASTFQDPMGAYRFTVPDGWESLQMGLALFGRDNLDTTINISASPSMGVSLDDQIKMGLPLFMQLPGYAPAGNGVTDLTLGGQPAKAFAYYSNDLTSGKPRFTGVILATRNDTTYVLVFEAARDKESAYDADIMTIVTSWEFI